MKTATPLLLLAAAVLVATTPRPSRAATDKPNIIYLLADDLGYNELGCYGQKWIKTPHIDAIAAEGMKFTQHYSGAPVCAPSRCVLMTGMHSGHAYIRNNGEVKPEGQRPIPDSTVTVAELLKQRGYATAAIGKWGLGFPGSEGDPNKQGFDLFFGFNCQRHAHNHYPRYLWRNDKHVELKGNTRALTGKQYSQDLFTQEALSFIKQNKDGPFFLYMPFAIPHLSIQVPEESLAQYKGKIPEADYKHRGYLKHPFPRAGYAAMISHLDRDIGKIMALVKELGLDDNTLVMFTSDNGPTYNRLGGSDSDFFESAKPLSGFKGSAHEGGIRVPLVARWPGRIKPGTTSDHISAFWDVLPTFCEVSGAKPPADIDGISFAPTLLSKGKQEQHEYLYWEFAAYSGQQAVRMGKWKALRKGMFRGNMHINLYDLEKDIAEQHDVSEKHPEVIARIKRIMAAAHTPSKVFPFKQIDAK
jgi:arylsulfatase